MKRSFVDYVTKCGYYKLAQHAKVPATYEWFSGHALAVSAKQDELLS
jgi:histidinol dehydrogenase